MTKSPLEFYDEELSRTIRQIQEGLLELEWPSPDAKTSQEDHLEKVDKLLTTADMFLQQIATEARAMQQGQEKTQWLEIVKFRRGTLNHLKKDRANVNIFQFPSLEDPASSEAIKN
ncbi:expressed unknown protein [Seminavis robusta]|uniref:Uncharacterized protein n=1 Tax=Seminavis robusta TaxID=568900 RepID=A0A9N8DTD1_9STRA|nr:expressed unknown protein [Seminavis robusta]|eukprot:Sro236_g095110.1 n/a (116) ;mRNA; r:73796-74143